jgi:hypothetical protein
MPSIFQKDCPECAAANALQAQTCACGYSFDSEDAGEADAQQEQLYRDYLTARVAQAEAMLVMAREKLAVEPSNAYNSAQALQAEQALNTARAQLDAHCLPTPKPKSSYQAPAPVVAKPTPAKTTATAKLPAAPIAAATVAARPTAVRSTGATAPTNRVATAGATRPDEVFRRLQAVKAQAALGAPTALTPMTAAPAPLSAPALPKSAVPLKQATLPKLECPHCTAPVAANATACACGYAFSYNGNEVPGLALDATALSVLTEALSPATQRKLR